MNKPPAKLQVRFFRTPSGNEPVKDWLHDLGKEDRKTIGVDIATCQNGWPIGLPVCKPFGKGLCEVRSNLQQNRISRVFFFVSKGLMFLLHAFLKTTKTTPKPELDLAKQRMAEQIRRIERDS